jgi:hypothetical protein
MSQKGYAKDKRDEAWCKELHGKALAALTDEWQDYYTLKAFTGLDYNVFEDLFAFGDADRTVEVVYNRFGRAAGSKSLFKLS